jgi:hypothetical protein
VDVGSEAVTPGPILIPEVAPEVETPAPILADAFEPVAQVSEPEQVTAWPFDHAFPTGTPVAAHVPPTEVPADVQLHPEGDPLFHAGSPTGKAS